MARRTVGASRPVTGGVRGEGGGRRRHLSPGTRAALARTRLIEVVPAGPSRLHSSAPPSTDEPPVVLHPLWAPVHPRRADGTDTRAPIRRTHVLHPSTPPRRGPRPGRRPRPVVPFDIPVEAFAVEVGGGAHPSVRSLGDRRSVYVEHRIAVRRAYRRRQLVLAVGLSGAFVATAVVALAPGNHAVASAATSARASDALDRTVSRTDRSRATARNAAAAARPARAVGPSPRRVHRSSPSFDSPSASAGGPRGPVAGVPAFEDNDGRHVPSAAVFPAASTPLADDAFLVCTRQIESVDAGGYGAVSPGGRYRGAYQFDQMTWNGIARHIGLFGLVGVAPDTAAPADQDLLAYSLYKWQGAGHWHHRCAGLS
jgi:hypothetical protein